MEINSNEQNNNWYIVTAIFGRLGLSDDYECVKVLHNFRKNILEKDTKYNDMLYSYDLVGPIIGQLVYNDPYAVDLCKTLLQEYLGSMLDSIRIDNNEEAVLKYEQMVEVLMNRYNIELGTLKEELEDVKHCK